MDFYENAFGAQEIMRMPGPNGAIGHAEMKIGDSPSCWRMSMGT